MKIEAAFLVLSDLHLSNDLYEAAITPQLSLPNGVYRLLRAEKLTDYFAARCRGHSVSCVKRLPRYLKVLLSEMKDEGYARDKFDLVLLLGDQSTLAHERSYKFLRQYLTQATYATDDGDGSYTCAGLGLDVADILAIPGNHDKMLRSSLDLYNLEFASKLKLTQKIRPQMCSISTRRFADQEFVFILVEPSTYCSQDLRVDATFRTHLAAGKVTNKLIEDVETKLTLLREHGKLDAEVKLERPFGEAVKILVVHYAVDDDRFGGLEKLLLPHKCEGLKELVTMLRNEYQLSMALHGHLHLPLLYNFNGVQVVSATTATLANKDGKTGIFVIKFLDSGTIRAEHHTWTGVAYTPDPDKSLSGDLGSFPTRPAAAA